MKTSEGLSFSEVFMGYRSGTLVKNWVSFIVTPSEIMLAICNYGNGNSIPE